LAGNQADNRKHRKDAGKPIHDAVKPLASMWRLEVDRQTPGGADAWQLAYAVCGLLRWIGRPVHDGILNVMRLLLRNGSKEGRGDASRMGPARRLVCREIRDSQVGQNRPQPKPDRIYIQIGMRSRCAWLCHNVAKEDAHYLTRAGSFGVADRSFPERVCQAETVFLRVFAQQ
jgi:hypothetical protein